MKNNIRKRSKLAFYYVLMASLFGFLVYYFGFIIIERNFLKNFETGAEELSYLEILDINHNVHDIIQQFYFIGNTKEYKDKISSSNLFFNSFSSLPEIERFILERDSQWNYSLETSTTPWMEELHNNELSLYLREIKDYINDNQGGGQIKEVFITNKYGVNVAQSDWTTDYYQADELWWQLSKELGYYYTGIEYDESADSDSLSLCTRLEDEYGNFLGVMKVVLGIEEIQKLMKIKYDNSKNRNLYQAEAYFLFEQTGELLDSYGDEEIQKQVVFEDSFRPSGNKDFMYIFGFSDEGSDINTGWFLLTVYDLNEVKKNWSFVESELFFIVLLMLVVLIILDVYILHKALYDLNNLYKDLLDRNKRSQITEIDLNKYSGFSRNIMEQLNILISRLFKQNKKKNEEKDELIKDLKKINKRLIGRELKMKELKEKIKDLEEQDEN
ncbi:MAG: hypothetical protein GF349_03510 [Candidatus Magasanikbacteria bacterium]|nr:hypothetical protein [Candidatus Magasanikbacteria bacterium]